MPCHFLLSRPHVSEHNCRCSIFKWRVFFSDPSKCQGTRLSAEEPSTSLRHRGRCGLVATCRCGNVSSRGSPKRKVWRSFSRAIKPTTPNPALPGAGPVFAREAAYVAQVCREPMGFQALPFNNSISLFNRAEPLMAQEIPPLAGERLPRRG